MRTMNAGFYGRLERYIDEFREANGMAPTIREIENALDIPRSTVSRYLSRMREKGMIEYPSARIINTKEMQITKNETVKVPVLGPVSCGIPRFAQENIEEYVRLPVALFGRGDFFILRAKGDSMIGANIEDGDLVLIRQQSCAEPGQIVVALMEEEATLKRYYPEPSHRRIRLHPENDSMEDIFVSNCVIQGIAVKVLKELEQS